MISNPDTLLSRVLETVTEPGPRIEKLRKIAAVVRENGKGPGRLCSFPPPIVREQRRIRLRLPHQKHVHRPRRASDRYIFRGEHTASGGELDVLTQFSTGNYAESNFVYNCQQGVSFSFGDKYRTNTSTGCQFPFSGGTAVNAENN